LQKNETRKQHDLLQKLTRDSKRQKTQTRHVFQHLAETAGPDNDWKLQRTNLCWGKICRRAILGTNTRVTTTSKKTNFFIFTCSLLLVAFNFLCKKHRLVDSQYLEWYNQQRFNHHHQSAITMTDAHKITHQSLN